MPQLHLYRSACHLFTGGTCYSSLSSRLGSCWPLALVLALLLLLLLGLTSAAAAQRSSSRRSGPDVLALDGI